MYTDDMIDDRETDTHTHIHITGSRFIHTIELLPHEGYLIHRDTDTII